HTMTEETKKLIMFTSLTIDDTLIMFSDCPPEMPLVMGNNISLTLVNTDENYLKKIFDALKQGGQITMPLQKTFWSPLYGMLTDQFGISWQFSQDEV
ncbi:MAG: VOC family protein, partial [Eubacterium sp.]